MPPFELTATERDHQRGVYGETIIINETLVIVFHVVATNVTDPHMKTVLSCMKRIKSTLKDDPFKFHLVIDLHRRASDTLPVSLLSALTNYYVRKRRYFLSAILTMTFLVPADIVLQNARPRMSPVKRAILDFYRNAHDLQKIPYFIVPVTPRLVCGTCGELSSPIRAHIASLWDGSASPVW